MYPDLALLVLRVVIGGVVIPHGLLKFGLVGKGGSIAGVAGWFNSMGIRTGSCLSGLSSWRWAWRWRLGSARCRPQKPPSLSGSYLNSYRRLRRLLGRA